MPAPQDPPEPPDAPVPAASDGRAPLVLVTGLSGAGNSTAIRALEDMGFEAIDNLPLSFIDRLFPETPAPGPQADPPRPLALGLDMRTRGFGASALFARLEALRETAGVSPHLLFLDCADPVLIDRYKTTRRRHPLAPDGLPAEGIAREREALWPVKERADLVIDTTELTPHGLKARLAGLATPQAARRLAIAVQSFSFKRGAPRDADSVFDCRFLRNPHWQPDLRRLDGRDAAVAAHVQADPLYAPFILRVEDLTRLLLPAYRREGKAYYCIALGCSGGRHRSVAAAEDLAGRLAAAGWPASLRHRELDGAAATPPRGGSGGPAA
ncbi:MAG: RNase adapter RapZ [Pseudomonadota bacterium]